MSHELLAFTHPGHRADWRFFQDRLWHHKLPSFTLETRLVRTGGSSFWCQGSSTRFRGADRELGYSPTRWESSTEMQRKEGVELFLGERLADEAAPGSGSMRPRATALPEAVCLTMTTACYWSAGSY